MSTPLRQRMIEDMQLRGLAVRTQDSYVRAVRQLAEYYGQSPAQLSEEELRQYFLYLRTCFLNQVREKQQDYEPGGSASD